MHVHYRPEAHVLDRLEKIDFVAVVGPTAVGKTTLMNAAIEHSPDLHFVRTTTSRDARPGERDGRDYHFLTRKDMEPRIAAGDYVQVAPSLLGELYATAPEDYPAKGAGIMAVVAGAMATFRALPFREVRTVFVVPPSWEVWQERLKTHDFTEEQLRRRLHEAEISFRFGLADEQTHFVINNTLPEAIDDFIALALGKPLSERLQADQSRARTIVRNLLDRMQGK